MEFVEIRYEMPIEEYTPDHVNMILTYHSARLQDTIFTDDKVILVMVAPSNWRIVLMQSILSAYRYM